ncbi:MAG TPA: dethiobiotin synthase [Candidatus Acidoferrales bacterium]|jgi:dethiobiotin synthase|nr:dethiobiotin synthase [Candidatus Acidoferrales bacterium]
MGQRYFITGTDTGVGKTVLSALLCGALDACYWKPIQTGTDEEMDSRTVADLAELPEARIIPEAYRFRQPVSPHLAARWAGERILLKNIEMPEVAPGAALIVEGAGGVLVPLNEREFMVDLMRDLKLPVLLAARSTLGTINHTLLSLAALGRAGLDVAGVVLIGERNADNREAIEEFGRVRVVGEIPPLEKLCRAALFETFENHFDKKTFISAARSSAASASSKI